LTRLDGIPKVPQDIDRAIDGKSLGDPAEIDPRGTVAKPDSFARKQFNCAMTCS
jgi:hypothetical protein